VRVREGVDENAFSFCFSDSGMGPWGFSNCILARSDFTFYGTCVMISDDNYDLFWCLIILWRWVMAFAGKRSFETMKGKDIPG
jgi:hypothetical protein